MEVRRATIEMQFCRFITGFDDLMKIQQQVDEFMADLSSKPIKIFAFQLACTCHWVSLMVVVVNRQLFFYYFDSKNLDCYNLTEEQIWEKINQVNEERKRNKVKPEWNDFKILCQVNCLKDINILVKLLPDMFLKKTTIYDHILATSFKSQYVEYWKPSIVDPLENLRKMPERQLVYNHLVAFLGDLKTFIHYLESISHGHHFLSTASKNYFLEVYIEIQYLLDKCLPSINGFRKGREILQAWEETKNNLGRNFQPAV